MEPSEKYHRQIKYRLTIHNLTNNSLKTLVIADFSIIPQTSINSFDLKCLLQVPPTNRSVFPPEP